MYCHVLYLYGLTHSFPTRRSYDLFERDVAAFAVALVEQPQHRGSLCHRCCAGFADRGSRGIDRDDIGCRLGSSEENTSELHSLMSTPYAVFCLQKKNITKNNN